MLLPFAVWIHVEAMKNLFEKYGEVLECQIIQDPVTKRSRLAVNLIARVLAK